MKQLADTLTQKANVWVAAQGWTDGAETLGTETQTYSQTPCLVLPMSPADALQAGLNLTDRPATVLFKSDKLITEDVYGQPYQIVKITVGDAVYYAAGPQVLFGADIGADDLKVVQVQVSQRQAVIA